MAYCLDPKKDLDAEVRRIAREQVRASIDDLTTGVAADRQQNIHSARKRFKKLRSLLRLVRPLRDDGFPSETRLLRDAGRQLAATRDADVLVVTVRELGSADPANSWSALEAGLRPGPDIAGLEETLQRTVSALQDFEEKIAAWPALPSDSAAVTAGIASAYRKGRKAWIRAESRRTPEALHEWRKRVKDLWYDTRLLSEADPVMMGRAASLGRLADVLGSRHDLDVLEATVKDDEGLRARLDWPAGQRSIQKLRAELDREAFVLGGLIYSEKPAAFESGMRSLSKGEGQPRGSKRRSRASKTATSE
ncbi:MAG: CHAD domain-containing protein [Thermoanaerobaculia bacterium]